MAIVDEIERIKTNIENAYTEIENKGVITTGVKNSDNLASTISAIQTGGTGGGSEITKGVIINECDSDGYPIDVSVVGMTSIPTNYFYYSASPNGLLSKVGSNWHLPNDLTSIGDYAFYSCTKMTIDKLPDSITSIGTYAFSGCSNLKLTSLPSNLTTIGSYAFNSSNLPITSLPDGLTSIGSNAFNYAYNFNITTVPVGVTVIPSYCFYSCDKLTELTLLGNITKIDTYAFQLCSKLTRLVLPNVTSVPTLSNKNAFSNTPFNNGYGGIYVPDSLLESFKSASNWSNFAARIRALSTLEG